MTVTSDPRRLFTERRDTYDRFLRGVSYPQGLRAYFLESNLLRPGLRVLDAGCGTGVVTLALRDAMVRRGVGWQLFHEFDLTPAMLDHFREILQRRAIADVTLTQADVLDLAVLPSGWFDYDLVVSASMLEYVPQARIVDALMELRARLGQGGQFVLFITRRKPCHSSPHRALVAVQPLHSGRARTCLSRRRIFAFRLPKIAVQGALSLPLGTRCRSNAVKRAPAPVAGLGGKAHRVRTGAVLRRSSSH